MTNTEIVNNLPGTEHEFWLTVVCGPACQGRAAPEAMAYSMAMLTRFREIKSHRNYWHHRSTNIWKQIVSGVVGKGRSIQDALEYAELFRLAERAREDSDQILHEKLRAEEPAKAKRWAWLRRVSSWVKR